MTRLVEIRISNDADLVKAIKELSWQGNHALITGTPLVIEFWGGEQEGVQCLDTPSLVRELCTGYSEQ